MSDPVIPNRRSVEEMAGLFQKFGLKPVQTFWLGLDDTGNLLCGCLIGVLGAEALGGVDVALAAASAGFFRMKVENAMGLPEGYTVGLLAGFSDIDPLYWKHRLYDPDFFAAGFADGKAVAEIVLR